MFGGLHLLGEAPGADEIAPGGFPDWLEPKMPEGDFDMISVAYYSPDAGIHINGSQTTTCHSLNRHSNWKVLVRSVNCQHAGEIILHR